MDWAGAADVFACSISSIRRRVPLGNRILQIGNRDFSAVWLGHATVLLRVAGKTILTDPVLSHRVGVGLGLMTAGPKRLIAAALDAHELPKLDLILISHAHFDHLDRPTLVKLHKSTPVVTASRTADLVRDLGFRNITELSWGQSCRLDGISLTACEVKHWAPRTFHDTYRGYNGYLIDGNVRRVFYSGDTAYRRFNETGNVDLAIFGIGAYDPYIAAHATPEQVWQMFEHLARSGCCRCITAPFSSVTNRCMSRSSACSRSPAGAVTGWSFAIPASSGSRRTK